MNYCQQKHIFRCTRNQPYQHEDAIAGADLSCRQGYYIEASSEAEAIAKMMLRFSEDRLGFTAQFWS